jgi:hypothetical protein
MITNNKKNLLLLIESNNIYQNDKLELMDDWDKLFEE